MIAIGQEPQGIEADFAQHAGKEDNAGGFDVVAARGLILHVVDCLRCPAAVA
jgi:hypothetical protein